ncbi:MAG: PAS domain-containing protein [Verrucomicrobiales bacterium]|nr:PAS domain-containing protein [Verrucomicrobiales bacterium]MCP5559129.1 PAS domain-containing protein [Verrucomicrobiaceae bacterium]
MRTLRFKLSAVLLLFGTTLISYGFVRHQQQFIESQRQRLLARALAEATRLAGVAQHVFRRGLVQTMDLEVSYLATDERLRLGLICDGDSAVISATEQRWRGLKLVETPLKHILELVEETQAAKQGKVVADDHTITAVFPFLPRPAAKKPGAVILDYAWEDVRQDAQASAISEAVPQSLVLLASVLVLWQLLQWMVTRRIELIEEQTKLAEMGEYDIERLPGSDELAHLSQAFAHAIRTQRDLWVRQQPLLRLEENVRDLFWSMKTTEPSLLFVNAAYETVWGRKVEALRSRHWDWLRAVRPSERRQVLRSLRSLMHGEDIGDITLQLGRADSPHWVQCRSFRVFEKDGSLLSIAGIVLDITASRLMDQRLAQAAETERLRMGRDLHDDVCQRLAAIQLKCGVAASLLAREGAPAADVVKKLAEDMAATTVLTRSLARGLAPVGLDTGGLSEPLKHLALLLKHAFDVNCVVECDAPLPPLNPEAATHMFRIAQELATNAAKHGKAKQVLIQLAVEDDLLRMIVSNDGSPFDGKPEKSDGLGLHFIRQRVDALGASIDFEAATSEDDWNLTVCEAPISALIATDNSANSPEP